MASGIERVNKSLRMDSQSFMDTHIHEVAAGGPSKGDTRVFYKKRRHVGLGPNHGKE
jgi:hypothetical protein